MKITPTKTFLGLDISDLSLRLVQIKHGLRTLKISSFNEMRLDKGIIKDGEIIDKEKMVEALKNLAKGHRGEKITGRRVVACLPEKKSFIKMIPVTVGQEDDLDNAMQKEVIKHIPYKLNEIYFDWQIIEKRNEQQYLVLVSACPKNIIDSYLDVIEKVKLKPLALEVESQALTRSLLDKKLPHEETSLIIDIGLDRSTFIIANKNTIYSSFATNKISGNTLTSMLAKELNISSQEAEKIKRSSGLTDARVNKVANEYIANLSNIIKQNVDYYKENFSATPLKKIILSGGGAYTKGLSKLIKQKLGATTALGDPWVNLPALKNNKLIGDNLSYATVIGLALRIFLKEGQ